MKTFVMLICLMTGFISGCASLNNQTVEFRATSSTSFGISSDQFNTVELQPSEILLWKGADLIGSITTVKTNPKSETAINEVKQGFVEAQKGPGAPRELTLPEGAYGFASSFRGFTTAFIAVVGDSEFWITISVKDDVFDQVLSSITVR